MNGGPPGQLHGERRRVTHLRPAVVYAAIGIFLTMTTMATGLSNLISPQQTIAMALSAGLITFSSLLRIIVPNAWNAWRRGFREGCRTAMESYRREQLPPASAEESSESSQPDVADHGIVDLLARSAARQLRKSQRCEPRLPSAICPGAERNYFTRQHLPWSGRFAPGAVRGGGHGYRPALAGDRANPPPFGPEVARSPGPWSSSF